MNREDILEEIAELKERLSNLEKMYNSLNPPNKRWRAKKKDEYYFICSGGALGQGKDHNTDSNNSHYTIGNYFQTREEAEFEIERLKVIAELREWSTPINDFNWAEDTRKYVLVVANTGENSYLAVDFYYTNQLSDLCFVSEEVAKNAIEAVGEERIIKYYFRRGE